MRIILSAITSVIIATWAIAADLPVKAPMQPLLPAPYNWTGFYLGIAGGGGWANSRHTNAVNGINSGNVGISGGLFGGTYGYNWQLGSWVLGFEGDFSWSGIRSSFSDNNGSDFCSPAVEIQCVTNLLWFGTDRARLGYAWDRLLVYATAGVAYGKVEGTLKRSDIPRNERPEYACGLYRGRRCGMGVCAKLVSERRIPVDRSGDQNNLYRRQ